MATKKKNLLVDHPAWAERLSKEWDWEKNNEMGIKPDEITAGSGKKVAWKCEKGHEWEATIASRVNGNGCPICAGKQVLVGFNDLATTNPDLAKEWHPTRNGDLTPQEVTTGSNRKVWWLGKCDHEWQAVINARVRGNGCPICAGKQVLVGFNDLATTNPDLADEWHPTKNGITTPQEVTVGSHKKVWWIGKCGHEWQASILSRTKGNGCPICAGKQVLPGFNDLATTNPTLAEEWHRNKNGDLTPQGVTGVSGRKVWWLGECGHEWEARIASRSNGQGCPICAGKQVLVGFNDLATTNPDLAKEWHPTRNGDLTPQEVTTGSHRKVWWRGRECGHEWEATVLSRTFGKGCGCPICNGKQILVGFNDLLTTDPNLAAEWNQEKNENLTPQEVTTGSHRKVWWRGRECGHEWEASINSRSRGSGCPFCSGLLVLVGETDLATINPELANEWHPFKNGNLTPQDVKGGSEKKVWWLGKCGHEWEASIKNRSRRAGCPKCSSSHGEKDAASWAVSQGFVVSEQWKDSDCRDKNPLPFDLMLYSVAGTALMETALIEYDGEQHSNENSYFNKKAFLSGQGGFDYVQRHDAIKTAFCMSTHRILIRVPYTVTGEEAIGEYISEKLRENGLGWAVRRDDDGLLAVS